MKKEIKVTAEIETKGKLCGQCKYQFLKHEHISVPYCGLFCVELKLDCKFNEIRYEECIGAENGKN